MPNPPLRPPGSSFSFTDYQQRQPNEPLPGDRLDIELQALRRFADSVVALIAVLPQTAAELPEGSIGLDQLTQELRDDLAAALQDITIEDVIGLAAALFAKSQTGHGHLVTIPLPTAQDIGDLVDDQKLVTPLDLSLFKQLHLAASQLENDSQMPGASIAEAIESAALSGGGQFVDLSKYAPLADAPLTGNATLNGVPVSTFGGYLQRSRQQAGRVRPVEPSSQYRCARYERSDQHDGHCRHRRHPHVRPLRPRDRSGRA